MDGLGWRIILRRGIQGEEEGAMLEIEGRMLQEKEEEKG